MKSIVLALTAAILICNVALAQYYDGANLVKYWREYQKHESERPFSAVYVGQYLGYVSGVTDTLDGIAFDIPDNVKMGQIYAIVGKYLDDHPSDWNLPADVLVTRSLEKAFPKK